ncbi:MAG TPA: DUF3079 domain-containing protein [Vicinamibacterales bacterium]|nr:DUF3079 domain-containing protein [Vicinamibacterales bacterium]
MAVRQPRRGGFALAQRRPNADAAHCQREELVEPMRKVPVRPPHPERICWGCDKYCPADDLACGNGTIRTLHPCELFGDDWLDWSLARTPPEPHAVDDRAPAPATLPPARDDDERIARPRPDGSDT